MLLETPRLLLRELNEDDFDALYAILSDAQTMRYYPAALDAAQVHDWIARNRRRYAQDGFGLWAVILKETGALIGDCGITVQSIHGRQLPEIGYHIHKVHQRRGYASEAAARCMRYAFETLRLPAVYSYMKYTNVASYTVAIKNGMHFVEEYADPVNTRTRVYAITRDTWMQAQHRSYV